MERTMCTIDTIRLMVTATAPQTWRRPSPKANPVIAKDPERRASATAQQAIITLEPMHWTNFKPTCIRPWTTGGRQRHVVGLSGACNRFCLLDSKRRDMEIGTGVRPMRHLPIESSEPVSGPTSPREKVLLKGMTC
jgi:hypothetical protein